MENVQAESSQFLCEIHFEVKCHRMIHGIVFTDNKAGALFISSLIGLTQHEICEEVDCLEGKYKDAFFKVFGLVEDSGWNLSDVGEVENEDS